MKDILVVFTLILLIFSCEEKLKDGEYYETITIGDNYTTQRVKVIQIDTVFERSGDRYVGGWINNYYVVGPHGKGTWTCSKGRVKEGLWEYGDFLGEETFDIELSKSKVVPQSVQELCVLEIKL